MVIRKSHSVNKLLLVLMYANCRSTRAVIRPNLGDRLFQGPIAIRYFQLIGQVGWWTALLLSVIIALRLSVLYLFHGLKVNFEPNLRSLSNKIFDSMFSFISRPVFWQILSFRKTNFSTDCNIMLSLLICRILSFS